MATTAPTRTWTYEDLFRLPDDGKRYEIIDGELCEMPSPSFEHSTAVMYLIAIFLRVVTAVGGLIRTDPLDVFMKGANPVQPDIVILLRDRLHLISSRGIEGAPNLLMEIMSPSNSAHDRLRKWALYAQGGVDEYWLVSPEAAIIEVYVREGDTYELLVRAGGNEPIKSRLFPELAFSVSTVFAVRMPGSAE
jgi:Uma2 family endonuclease